MNTPGWFLKRNLAASLLLPLAGIYYIVSRLVYFSRLFHQKTSKRPVICIGNILAGGVGKTPIVQKIAGKLGAPVIMRGYGAAKPRQRAKSRERRAEIIGDEAAMLEKAGIKVYTGDRIENINILNHKSKIINPKSPIVMDDGFQNPMIKKDLSILVFDESIGLGNGFLLPAGPLREPPAAIKRADAAIIIKSKEQSDYAKATSDKRAKSKNLEHIIRKYKKPVFYAMNETLLPSSLFLIPYIAFAGIGYPQKFFDALNPRPIQTKSFPDHYPYTPADLKKLLEKAGEMRAELVTTEKDWVRMPPWAQAKIKVAKLETTIEPAFWTWLKRKLNENEG